MGDCRIIWIFVVRGWKDCNGRSWGGGLCMIVGYVV